MLASEVPKPYSMTRMNRRATASSLLVPTVLLALLVTVGILGMHTVSTAPMASATASTVEIASMDAHALATTSHPAPDSGCADCGAGGGHSAMMLACVLGLLVVVLLAAKSTPGLLRARGPSLAPAFVLPRVFVSLRPPSLIELSISRT
ncbi:DUF6153 family protein [Microbacterium sp. NPDC079356]